jgi:hypothetical protein
MDRHFSLAVGATALYSENSGLGSGLKACYHNMVYGLPQSLQETCTLFASKFLSYSVFIVIFLSHSTLVYVI